MSLLKTKKKAGQLSLSGEFGESEIGFLKFVFLFLISAIILRG